jgi:SulP family sulfate permease
MARVKISRFLKKAYQLIARQNHLDLFPARHYLVNYNRQSFFLDGRAAINLSLLAFPQGMAYALIAGLPIQFGILAFISASLIAALFASSRFNSYGPSNATSVLILSTFLTLQLDPETILIALPLLVLFTGITLVISAYMRVARVVQYVSKSVITGYITGAALLIIANQVKNTLGFDIPKAASFYGVIHGTVSELSATHWPSLLIASLTAATLILLNRYAKGLPNIALTLVIMAFVSALLAWLGYPVRTLNPASIADWSVTKFHLRADLINQLMLAAFALAFLITLEACSIGKSLAARSGDRLNPNQEIFGLGLGNIASAFCGGMVASASLTRSSLNCNSNAATPFANCYAAILVLCLFILFGPLIAMIPQPALAVLVISIGVTLISRHNIRVVSKATRSDAVVFYTTLLVGLIFALDTAIYVGTVVSIVLFLGKVAEPEMVEYDFNDDGQLAEVEETRSRSNPEVSIVHVEGELFFGAADVFHDQMRRVCDDPNLKIVILKMRNAHHIDATSVMAFEELVRYMKEKNRYMIISEARKDVLKVLKRSGIFDTLNRDNIFPDHPNNPTLSTAKALKRAKQILGGEEANVSIYIDPKKDKQKKLERAMEN